MRHRVCKHFTGLLNDACRVGIQYEDVKKLTAGKLCCLDGLPCPCTKYEEPTEEDIAAYHRKTQQIIEELDRRYRLVEPALRKIRARYRGRNMHGRMTCPVCKVAKAMTINHAASNGHCHVFCETDGCIRLME